VNVEIFITDTEKDEPIDTVLSQAILGLLPDHGRRLMRILSSKPEFWGFSSCA